MTASQADGALFAQVVAGTNYAFAFDAAYSCAPDNAIKTTALNAIAYEPLPGDGNGFQARSSGLARAAGLALCVEARTAAAWHLCVSFFCFGSRECAPAHFCPTDLATYSLQDLPSILLEACTVLLLSRACGVCCAGDPRLAGIDVHGK